MTPVTRQVLSPAEYLKIVEEDPRVIKSMRLIPPKLGQRDFGRIEIERKRPIYSTSIDG